MSGQIRTHALEMLPATAPILHVAHVRTIVHSVAAERLRPAFGVNGVMVMHAIPHLRFAAAAVVRIVPAIHMSITMSVSRTASPIAGLTNIPAPIPLTEAPYATPVFAELPAIADLQAMVPHAFQIVLSALSLMRPVA